jgi:glyoxylase-like metal-dependent hydrolase (beta-lactamase superfamily II)
MRNRLVALSFLALAPLLCPGPVRPQQISGPKPQKIGADLYAYISDNDGSANSAFLVTPEGILVVDTGVNPHEAQKLLAAIRSISPQPIRYIVNTHYHPDHQGGNATLSKDAVIITTPFTRERTQALLAGSLASRRADFRIADEAVPSTLTIFLGGYPVEISAPGKGHTLGDAVVYFPQQQAIALGDLFMHGSCPAMDEGSAENWIKTLDSALAKPLQAAVPGHFALGTKDDVRFFRDYLANLFSQVKKMTGQGLTLEQVRSGIRMEKYSTLRQFPQYEATFADNAAAIYHQLNKTDTQPN